MATQSVTLAWGVPGTEEPGRLQSTGSQRVRHDSVTHTFAFLCRGSTHRRGFFPAVMYGCESGTIKKAESCRIDAFGWWSWRRLLRVPWTASRADQSILKEISPEYSLEGLMLELKLQSFGHLL